MIRLYILLILFLGESLSFINALELPPIVHAQWTMLTKDLSSKKPYLIVFIQPLESNDFLTIWSKAKLTDDYKRLSQKFSIIELSLENNISDKTTALPWILAEAWHVQGTPTFYLCRKDLVPSHRILGWNSTTLSQLLQWDSSPSNYSLPKNTKGLEAQRIRQLAKKWQQPLKRLNREECEERLKEVCEELKIHNSQTNVQQYLLYEQKIPLELKLARYAADYAGRGVFSAQADRLIRESLHDLSTIILLDKNSFYGQEALKLKNQINEARRKINF